jgi:hypothetical protein
MTTDDQATVGPSESASNQGKKQRDKPPHDTIHSVAMFYYEKDPFGPWYDNAAAYYVTATADARWVGYKDHECRRLAVLGARWEIDKLDIAVKKEETKRDPAQLELDELGLDFMPLKKMGVPRTIRMQAGKPVKVKPQDFTLAEWNDYKAFLTERFHNLSSGLEEVKKIDLKIRNYWSDHPNTVLPDVLAHFGIEVGGDD